MSNIAIWIFTGGILLFFISTITQLKSDIARIQITLDNIAKEVGVSDELSPDLKELILKLISKGEIVRAVKEYRTATGAGLVEAKNYIDSLSDEES